MVLQRKNNKWALIGLGFISQRHIQAIEDIGDELIVACDTDKKKKDKCPKAKFFTNTWEMMQDKLWQEVDWVAICTPNYLHAPMILAANEKNIICEKPLTFGPDNLKMLEDLDNLKTNKPKIFTVLQL